ncbi:MAG: hypothetical protein GY795_18260 [Desulfobacterales bacterium]|nr:hypothetical protein [Desulfobacterales bacterium]
MTRQKTLTSFITFLLIMMTIAGANAQENQAYWVDVSTNTRLDNLVLPTGEERVISLMAEVPANKTLQAYSLGIIYDSTKVSVEVVEDPEYVFTLTTNVDIPGAVDVNGFDLSGGGVEGEDVALLISLRVNGITGFSSCFAVFFTAFGAFETPGTTDEFIPSVVPLDINPVSGWVSIWGRVLLNEDIPLCAMVLVNGQHMFSCRGDGRYALYVPMDADGKISILCFGDGFDPSNTVLSPSGSVNHDISMDYASPNSSVMTVTKDYVGPGENNPDWIKVSGTVYYGDKPLCSMVLANGQHMFTCDEQAPGQYSLEVPLYEGNITLFGFVDGFLQYKDTFKP